MDKDTDKDREDGVLNLSHSHTHTDMHTLARVCNLTLAHSSSHEHVYHSHSPPDAYLQYFTGETRAPQSKNRKEWQNKRNDVCLCVLLGRGRDGE